MPVCVIFRCDICGTRPDPDTQRELESQLLELLHGEYLDAQPGRWLTWSGQGLFGARRYACGAHRGELKAALREEYGAIGDNPWAMGPHPWAGRRASSERAWAIKRGLRAMR